MARIALSGQKHKRSFNAQKLRLQLMGEFDKARLSGKDWLQGAKPESSSSSRGFPRVILKRFAKSARAKIRVVVKRILNRFGYPPDLQQEAVKTVLMQAELLCAEWAA